MKKLLILSLLLSHLTAPRPLAEDTFGKPYEKQSGISGKLNSVGSDTFNTLMALWVEKFQIFYPNIKIQVEGKGSSTAAPALIVGASQLGPMSREMKRREVEAFEKKFGYKPLKIAIAIDALAVFIHKDNPLITARGGLTLQEVDSIFSSTYKRGGTPLANWGELLASSMKISLYPLSLYGRNSASGTYGFFKSKVLLKGDYNERVKEQPGSSAVVQGISSDIYSMGYSSLGYLTSGVKAVPISRNADEPFAPPRVENCVDGSYPLARLLYIYINKPPGKGLDPLTLEFLKFTLSQAGQAIVKKTGLYPLTSRLIEKNLQLIQ